MEISSIVLRDENGRITGYLSLNRDITDRKQSEEALRESEQKYRLLVDNASEAIVVAQDGILKFVNRMASDITGYSEQVLTSRPFSEFIHPDDRGMVIERYLRRIKGDVAQPRYVFRLKVRDDSIKWVEIDAVLIDWEGKPATLNFLNDVTERKLAEESLRESEAKYRTLVENIPQKIFMKDRDSKYLSVNESFARDLGVGPADIAGKTDYSFFPKDLADKYRADDFKIMETAQTEEFEEKYLLEGRETWVHTIKTPVRDENGKIIALLGVFWDITERRRAEQEILRQKQYFETLVSNSPVAIVVLDNDAKITSCNPSFEKLFGYNSREVLGVNIDTLITDPESYDEALQYTQQAMTSLLHNVGKRRRRDGSLVDVEIFGAPVTVGGENVGALAIYHDISELVNTRQEAEQSNRAKSEFLANMSHEIRTPMNGVIGMLELALDTSMTSEQREYLSISLQSAEALLGLINEILDFSKIEARGVELEKIDFDLRNTVEEMASTLAMRAQDKGLELACLINPDLKVKLHGDPARLRQILINLVGNAVKFTHQGEIVVRAEPTAETETHITIRFAVQDTGIGIPQERQKAIFERFTQADGSTTRKYGGTGLGLTICKRLVEAMGGQIWIESTVGVGSTFLFTITFEKQAGEAQAVAPLVFEPVELKDLRLLGVDDSATNRTILTRMAESFGCRIETVGSGAKALEMLQNAFRTGDPFRVILLDMQMPGMDGEQTVRAIKSDPVVREVKIIILTSIGQRGDAARLEALGVAGYLLKPLKQQMLREALIAVLGRKEEGRPILITRHVLSEQKRQGLRLLIAEDNPINQRLAVILLQKAGFSVDTVENGAQAVEQVQKKHFNAVLMDVQMPEMDGFEATVRIRQLEGRVGHIPIIAMTADALKGDRERCLDVGMDDYVSKPLDPPTLMKIIDQWTQPGLENTVRAEAATNSEVQDYTDRLVTSPFVEADLATEGGLFGEETQQVVSSLPSPVQDVKQIVLETELPVDIRSAMVRFEGDRSFFLEMVQEFTEHLADRMFEMKAALEVGDANRLSHHAHNLKGVAANFSAEPLVRLAKELETSGKQEDLADAPALLSAIQAESERVCQFCADIESKIKSLGY